MEYHSLIQCPYDEAHMIAPLRMPYHLMKCRKNHPHKELVVCPFNAMHEVHKAELRYHIEHCPDKALLEREILHDTLRNAALDIQQPMLKGYTDLPKYNYKKTQEIVSDEWDREASHANARFSLFASNHEIRLSRMDEAEMAPVRYPLTSSKAAQLSGPSGTNKQLRSQKVMESATSNLSKTNSDSLKTTPMNQTAGALSVFPSCRGVGRGSGLVPEMSSSETESSSRSSVLEMSSSSSTSEDPSTEPLGVGRGRGSIMSVLIGRGRARPSTATDHCIPKRPGNSNSNPLQPHLPSLNQRVDVEPYSVSAIARGRQIKTK